MLGSQLLCSWLRSVHYHAIRLCSLSWDFCCAYALFCIHVTWCAWSHYSVMINLMGFMSCIVTFNASSLILSMLRSVHSHTAVLRSLSWDLLSCVAIVFNPCYVVCIVTLQCLDHCHGIYYRASSLFLSMLRSVLCHTTVL